MVLYHTVADAALIEEAARQPDVLNQRVFAGRITADPHHKSEIQKVYEWQDFVSIWNARRDVREFGLRSLAAREKYIEAQKLKGSMRLTSMYRKGNAVVFKCLTDKYDTGLNALYAEYDRLCGERDDVLAPAVLLQDAPKREITTGTFVDIDKPDTM